VGALLGTLVLATLAHRILRPGTTLLVSAVCMGLALIVFAVSPGMWLALPMLLLVGFANTMYLTQITVFIQQNVPDHLRGRILGVYSLCWNLLPLGGLLAGAMAAAVDARFAVLVGGGMVAANALLLLSSRRLRGMA
jgi:predicted MFS family arabinose efflux permease